MAKQFLTICILLCVTFVAFGQANDPVLFKVEDTPVHVSEFEYIYTKTNGDNADFSKASLEEYLDLYVKFKLKVQKARNMQLDTIASLNRELDGYRQQLADSYLIDREVTDKLVEELHERKKQDVDISHIMVDRKGLEQLKKIKVMLDEGKDFEELAKQYSIDKTSNTRGGHVGYITAILPKGFYAFETAAYTQEIDIVSDPIETPAGYHLMKVHSRRPARGEMEIAHILVRTKKDGSNAETAKIRAEEIYKLLNEGAKFEEVAKEQSQDKDSAEKGGYLGFFGINRYEKSFEDAAFALATNGAMTEPVQTRVGWHIIQRVSKKEIQPLKQEKSQLEQKVSQDPRFELAKTAMIERIKQEGDFKETATVLQTFKDSLNDQFLTFRWKAPEVETNASLFSFGTKNRTTLGDFVEYVQDAARKRIRMGRNKASIEDVVTTLYNDFVGTKALQYEERQLEAKYPAFKSLMREYEEGILLFEATKRLVWDKASQDTIGLNNFFGTVKSKYNWKDRAVMTKFNLSEKMSTKVDQVRDYVASHTTEEAVQHFTHGDDVMIVVEEKTYEKGRNAEVDAIDWKQGTLTDTKAGNKPNVYTFMRLEEVLAPSPKSLKQARGYVVADYQDHLEKEWVSALRKEYDVKINKRVFNSLSKKRGKK